MPNQTPRGGSAEPHTDWDALARYLAGESPAAERVAVQRWLATNPQDAELVSAVDRVVAELAVDPADLKRIDIERALAMVNAQRVVPVQQVSRTAPQFRRDHMHKAPASRWMPYAAAAALIIAIGALVARDRAPATAETQIAARIVSTPTGGRDSVVLSDGSAVIVGPGSELTISADYGRISRSVRLRGEAYFTVKHDASRPFVVSANAVDIHDVGTAFVVRSDSSGGVRVAVTEGVVELRPSRDSSRATTLNAGDVARVARNGDVTAQRGAGGPDDLAWMRGRLVFRDAPLSDVRENLQRWYGIHLDVRDPALLRRPLSASFEGEPINRVLDVISLALGATVEIRGDTAVMRAVPEPRRRE